MYSQRVGADDLNDWKESNLLCHLNSECAERGRAWGSALCFNVHSLLGFPSPHNQSLYIKIINKSGFSYLAYC